MPSRTPEQIAARREYERRPEVRAAALAKKREHYRKDPAKYIARAKAYREANPRKRSLADWAGHLRRSYGLTPAQYREMYEQQQGRCAICSCTEAESGRGKFVVDHMHCSGRVRALLCFQCNSGIGFFSESPEALRAAAAYIESHRSAAPATFVA